MGQRHQLFVIAKIAGKYRNLAAIHHQWLYGATALKRCHRLVQIFQANENRMPLEQELISARHLNEQSWKTHDWRCSGKDAVIPFPMITTCLTLGASFDFTDGYYHGVHIEPFGMEFDGGDNNNGITVIDVSNLSSVRYCFVDILRSGMESKTRVPLMTPLSASTYLWAYYDKNDKEDQEKFGDVVDRLEKWDLVDVAALRDTWPDGAWRNPGDVEFAEDERYGEEEEEEEEEEQEGSGEEEDEEGPRGTQGFEHEEGTGEGQVATGNLEAAGIYSPPIASPGLAPEQLNPRLDESSAISDDEQDPSLEVASLSIKDTVQRSGKRAIEQPAAGLTTLRDSAMNTMIETALRQNENELKLWMPEAELLNDFLRSLRRKIYEDPSVLKTSPAGLYLLCRALQGEQTVDLSPLETHSSKDIAEVVLKLKENGVAKFIALSNLPNLLEEDLGMILDAKFDLRGLCLIGSPLISIDYVVSLVNRHVLGLQDLCHTELLRRPFKLMLKQWRGEDKFSFSANLVNQMIWIRSDARISEDKVRLENGLVDWEKAMQAEKSLGYLQSSLTYGAFPFDDMLIPPVKFVTGLLNFLSWVVNQISAIASTHDHAVGLANSFAMAKSSIHGSGCQVGPLSTALYAARSNVSQTSWPFSMSSLTPGKWTILVFHELARSKDTESYPGVYSKLRYAMITTRDSSKQDLVVADMSTFLNEVVKAKTHAGSESGELQSYWTEHCKTILPDGGTVELCDESEVCSLVQWVFSPYEYKPPGRFDPYDWDE